MIADAEGGPRGPECVGTDRPWLALCWRVVRHRLTSLYRDATHLVAAHGVDPSAIPSPQERYRLHAVRALLLEGDGRLVEAREEARAALAVQGLERGEGAAVQPGPGLPPDPDADVSARLVALAG